MAGGDPELTLYAHPLSSYCWKVLIALWETETTFDYEVVRGRPAEHAAFQGHWPLGKMPLLWDRAREAWIFESSVIVEYLQLHHPGPAKLLPNGVDALETRLWDRVFDLYVHAPMQKLVADRLRPEDRRDPTSRAEAEAALDTAYAMLEARMTRRTWAANGAFGLADCAAMPALFYARTVRPFSQSRPALATYCERLIERPCTRRAIREAQPFFADFPFAEALEPRFTSGDFI